MIVRRIGIDANEIMMKVSQMNIFHHKCFHVLKGMLTMRIQITGPYQFSKLSNRCNSMTSINHMS